MPKMFHALFPVPKPIIGMVHLKALPGTAAFCGSAKEIIDAAMRESALLKKAGIDALLLENMHDVPYLKKEVGPEISSLMAVAAYEIKKANSLPCGIQVLAGANKAALAIAKAAGLDFIRAEGFVYAHVADEGWMDGCAGELLRYRKMIDAENVLIFTDIKKKHCAHAITADVDIVETAKTAAYFRSDGIILTGAATGKEADLNEIERVKKNCDFPLLIGSGVTIENVAHYLPFSDALVVGSHFKKNGFWANEMDESVVKNFMEKVRTLRRS